MGPVSSGPSPTPQYTFNNSHEDLKESLLLFQKPKPEEKSTLDEGYFCKRDRGRTDKEREDGIDGESMPSEDHHPRQQKYGLYKMVVFY